MLARLRHDHHRRGARAQPQHRLPAGLPEALLPRRARSQGRSSPRRRSMPSASRAISAHGPAGAGDRGVGAACIRSRSATGRSAGGDRRGRGRRRGGPRGGDRRRRRGALARRAAATSWSSCRASARSARPRDLLRAGLARRPTHARRDPAALRAAVGRRAAARVRAVGAAAHRARDQRRRDLAHRARHPLRDRHRARARQALQRAQQDRRCCRSRRSRRPPRNQRAGRCGRVARRHLRAPLRARTTSPRGRAYTDPEILRSLARGGDPAHGVARPRRRRGVSVPRAAAAARDRRRLPAAAGARRGRRARALTPLGRELARLPLDPRIGRMVLAARDAGLPAPKCWSSRARSSVPDPRERPLEKRAGGRPGAPAVPRRALGFPVALHAVGVLRRRSRTQKLSHRRLVDALPRAVRVVPAPARMARRARAARGAARGGRAGTWNAELPATIDAARYARSTRRCSRDCSATSACKTARARSYYRRARHPLPPASRAPGSRRSGRSGSWPPSSSRRRGCTRAAPRSIEPEWIEAVAGDRVHARLLRAALGRSARRGGGERARAALRAHARGAPPRVVRPRSIPALAREVFIREALVPGAFAHARRVPRAQPRARRRGRASSSTRRAGATCSSTTRRSPRSTTSACRRRRNRRELRALARRGRAQRPAAPVPDARVPDAARRGGRHRRALSRDAARWPARRCRSSTASRPAIRSTASRSRCRCAPQPARRGAPLVARAGHGAREGRRAT